jgi:transcriptional regulator with GAF, ATPase, and Fis domain
MTAALQHPDTRVQLVVCATEPSEAEAFGALPIVFPPLCRRTGDLPRIVSEYANDVTAELGVPRNSFSRNDEDWIIEHACGSAPEIERAIVRILRLREANGEMAPAAALLGMDRWSLTKWVAKHKPPVQTDRKKK